MIFQHTLDKVLDGSKTRTSRIIKPNQHYGCGTVWNEYPNELIHTKQLRQLYSRYETYAAQSGRGQKALTRIRILDIHEGDVREADLDWAKREGFDTVEGFWLVWCAMHDKSLDLRWEPHTRDYSIKMVQMWRQAVEPGHVAALLKTRPADRYQAWVIDFELVNRHERLP